MTIQFHFCGLKENAGFRQRLIALVDTAGRRTWRCRPATTSIVLSRAANGNPIHWLP